MVYYKRVRKFSKKHKILYSLLYQFVERIKGGIFLWKKCLML
nr:MAG TPA: hypothetical protein [Caudoviricetes sp.]